ncbi:MAG: hypothetical protein HZA18_05150 [Nitrospirae bacterium]|nr:hypothetical protein [Nitrospirota bacterium]
MEPFIVDNYIVRVYRREEDDMRKVAGIVEEVRTEEKRAFHNLDELWTILRSPRSKVSRKRKGNTKGK